MRPIVSAHPAACLIGQTPDTPLACVIGVTRGAVGAIRTARGLPAPTWRGWIDDAAAQAAFREAVAAEVAARPDRTDALNAACAAWVPDWAPVAPAPQDAP